MAKKTDLPTIPPALLGVALVDGAISAAAGGMRISWWHAKVKAGEAPAPAVKLPRCTRWRLSDVETFWADFASRAPSDTQAAEQMTAQAKKASAKAREPEAMAKAQATRKARIAARQGGAA